MADLDIRICKEDMVSKRGACTLIFYKNIVMADGRVNACACRDVAGTLVLGNIHERPLRELLTASNQGYLRMIAQQQRGEFPPVCHSCTFYRSIYNNLCNPFSKQEATVTLREFLALAQKSSPTQYAAPQAKSSTGQSGLEDRPQAVCAKETTGLAPPASVRAPPEPGPQDLKNRLPSDKSARRSSGPHPR